MSFSVTRPKSRRKFPHEAKNLDEVLNPSSSSIKSKHKSYDELSKRRSSSHHHHSGSRSSSVCSSDTHLASAASVSASAPRSNARKGAAVDDFFDLESISFQLGPIIYEMDDMGNWTSHPSVSTTESKSGSKGNIPLNFKESIAGLSDENKRIAQENNLLRVKNEVLADMVRF